KDGRVHLVVAVHLQHPASPRLPVAAEDGRAVAAVRLTGGNDMWPLACEVLDDLPGRITRTVVVDAELIGDSNPCELPVPRGHDREDRGLLVVGWHDERNQQFRFGWSRHVGS